MKKASFLALLLLGCGARVDEPVIAPPPVEPTPTSPTDSGLLRAEPEVCAFGAGAGHLVWIDAATRRVRVARATPGSAARELGTASSATCALAVRGTRFCFGDSYGGLTCMSVDGANYESHGERRPKDPVRTVDLGRDRGLVFGRSRTVYGRFDFEETLTTKTVAGDIVATVGDFEPSPDDGVELAVVTRDQLLRIDGIGAAVPIAAPVAVRALHYSAYLVLGEDGALRTVNAGDGRTTTLDLGGFVSAIAVDDRWSGENLVAARDGQIVAANGQLYFEPKLSDLRVVADTGGDVLSIAIDEDRILWATRGGELRSAKRVTGDM